MRITRPLPATLLVLAFNLAMAPALAASPPALDTLQSLKGIVVAKAEKSLAVRDGSGTVQVTVTEATRVTGQRDSFVKIAVGDIVRVDAQMAPGKPLQAGRIEVLFAAGASTGQPSQASLLAGLLPRAPILAGLLAVLANGGVTVWLP